MDSPVKYYHMGFNRVGHGFINIGPNCFSYI